MVEELKSVTETELTSAACTLQCCMNKHYSCWWLEESDQTVENSQDTLISDPT
jgi:hypothetical protein